MVKPNSQKNRQPNSVNAGHKSRRKLNEPPFHQIHENLLEIVRASSTTRIELNFMFKMKDPIYATWSKLKFVILDQLQSLVTAGAPPVILVPGMGGKSNISEELEESGFEIHELDISNYMVPDFKCVSEDDIQRICHAWFATIVDETIDAVVDKGALDLLTFRDVEFITSGLIYVNMVRSILKPGGKYICITSAEPEFLGLIFREFRCGWKTSLYAMPPQYPGVQTFIVVLEKDIWASVSKISRYMADYSVKFHRKSQRKGKPSQFNKALREEQQCRSKYADSRPLKELNLESLKEFEPGRVIKLILRDQQSFYCKAVLVDAEQHTSRPFLHQFAVYVVPEAQVNEWFFSVEDGQRRFASKLRAARLVMILLESRQAIRVDNRILQGHLSRVVRPLAPRSCQKSTILILPGTHDDDIVESDVELEIADLIEPEKDPPQKMGNPLIEVTEENQEAAQILKAKANEAISDGKFNEAIDYLTQAIMLNPKSAIMYATRASVFIKLEKPIAAARDANAALQINANSAKGYKARGMAFAMVGLWESAADDLHVASMLDFDEEIGSTLKKIEANAKRIKERRIKYDRLRTENELRKNEQERQKREDDETASVLKDGEVIGIHSASELEKKLNAASKIARLTILYFTSQRCGPWSVISTLAAKYPKAVFLKVDIEEVKEATGEWNISIVPCFSFVKNGKEVDKVVGADKALLEEKIALHA